MLYHSTRGKAAAVDSARAVLNGLAPDGGLYMPEKLPALDAREVLQGDVYAMATAILGAFLPEIPNMPELVRRAYTGKFADPGLTPTKAVGPFHVLELFHGPTSAFKDVALSMLPQLLVAAKNACGMDKDILILTATSGDTGKAALEGFHDVPGVRICVFYPEGGVSGIQRAQMVTQEGGNVAVCAVKGNFDDAQTGVKNIFAAVEKDNLLADRSFRLSSANSINIGRLVPQITYYFKAYKDLMEAGVIAYGDKVNFSVPTGNFGDILAGYFAKCLGLPVGRLLCASNANNVLTDFIRTGTYNRMRPLYKTTSPSMDILVSSNLERLLYLLSGDCALVAGLMEQLSTKGSYTVPDSLLSAIAEQFYAGCCDDDGAAEAIGKVWKQHGYVCDTHTAAGWAVAEQYTAETGDTVPMVVLSTASPYKFPTAVLYALGQEPAGDEYAQMDALHAFTGTEIPRNLASLQGKEEKHKGVVEKDMMLPYVLGL